MIKIEKTDRFKRIYSDKGFMIKNTKTSELYEEAIEPLDSKNKYQESDILIDEQKEEVVE